MFEGLEGPYGIVLLGLTFLNLTAFALVFYLKGEPRITSFKGLLNARLDREGWLVLGPMLLLYLAEVIGLFAYSYAALLSDRDTASARAQERAAETIIQCDLQQTVNELGVVMNRLDQLHIAVVSQYEAQQSSSNVVLGGVNGLLGQVNTLSGRIASQKDQFSSQASNTFDSLKTIRASISTSIVQSEALLGEMYRMTLPIDPLYAQLCIAYPLPKTFLEFDESKQYHELMNLNKHIISRQNGDLEFSYIYFKGIKKYATKFPWADTMSVLWKGCNVDMAFTDTAVVLEYEQQEGTDRANRVLFRGDSMYVYYSPKLELISGPTKMQNLAPSLKILEGTNAQFKVSFLRIWNSGDDQDRIEWMSTWSDKGGRVVSLSLQTDNGIRVVLPPLLQSSTEFWMETLVFNEMVDVLGHIDRVIDVKKSYKEWQLYSKQTVP